MLAQHICLPTVVELSSLASKLIIEKLYNLLFEKTVTLFYNNSFSIYYVILSDFDNLNTDKILEFFV